jgi:hypothetical protein
MLQDGDDGREIDSDEKLLDSSMEDVTASSSTDKKLYNKAISKKRGIEPEPSKFEMGQSYRTIRAARSAVSCLRQLNPNPLPGNIEPVSIGSFCTEGDDRIQLTNITHDLKNRRSLTLSFDPDSGECNSCLAGRRPAWTGQNGEPICVVVTDQNFPACLPARTAGKECVRVIRSEDSSLQALTHALADAIGKIRLPKNSVVLLGSLSHLSTSGTEHYLNDWIRSRWWIRERLGEDICVLPLVPIWFEGLYSRYIIRSTVETLTWFTTLNATEAVLMRDLHMHMLNTHFVCEPEVGWMAGRLCFRLPAGLDTRATIATVSEGWGSWPESVPPLSMAAEREIISLLLSKLDDAFGMNLDLDPCLARKMADIKDLKVSDTAEKWIAVIGSSHAANTAQALGLCGAKVEYQTSRGWKLSTDGVGLAVRKLTELEYPPDLVVLQVLDNNSYFVAKEDGTLSLPVRGHDGHYHIPGDLKTATKEQVVHIMKVARPLFEVLPTVTKVLILPIPRYCYPELKCCADRDHITNSGPALEAEVKSGLNIVKKTVRSVLFKEKLKNIKLIDPYSSVSGLCLNSYADPVHLTQAGYECIANTVLSVLSGEEEGDKEADPPSSSAEGSKRIRILSLGSGRGSVSRPYNWGRGEAGPPAANPRGRGGTGGRGHRGNRFGRPGRRF